MSIKFLKRTIIWILLLVATGCATVQVIDTSGYSRMAVIPIISRWEKMNWDLAVAVIRNLKRETKTLSIIGQRRIEEAMLNNGYKYEGVPTRKDAVRIARKLGADLAALVRVEEVRIRRPYREKEKIPFKDVWKIKVKRKSNIVVSMGIIDIKENKVIWRGKESAWDEEERVTDRVKKGIHRVEYFPPLFRSETEERRFLTDKAGSKLARKLGF